MNINGFVCPQRLRQKRCHVCHISSQNCTTALGCQFRAREPNKTRLCWHENQNTSDSGLLCLSSSTNLSNTRTLLLGTERCKYGDKKLLSSAALPLGAGNSCDVRVDAQVDAARAACGAASAPQLLDVASNPGNQPCSTPISASHPRCTRPWRKPLRVLCFHFFFEKQEILWHCHPCMVSASLSSFFTLCQSKDLTPDF